jgi:hypothetical protein
LAPVAGDDEEDDKPDAPAGNRDAPELEHVPVASRPIKAPADTAMLAEIEKVLKIRHQLSILLETGHFVLTMRPIGSEADVLRTSAHFPVCTVQVAGMVAKGETTSEEHRSQHPAEPVLSFLDVDSLYHTFYLKRLEHFRIAQEAFAAGTHRSSVRSRRWLHKTFFFS